MRSNTRAAARLVALQVYVKYTIFFRLESGEFHIFSKLAECWIVYHLAVHIKNNLETLEVFIDLRTHFKPFEIKIEDGRVCWCQLFPQIPDGETDPFLASVYARSKKRHTANATLNRWGDCLIRSFNNEDQKKKIRRGAAMHVFIINARRRYMPAEILTLVEAGAEGGVEQFKCILRFNITYCAMDIPPSVLVIFVPMYEYGTMIEAGDEWVDYDTAKTIISMPALESRIAVLEELESSNNADFF